MAYAEFFIHSILSGMGCFFVFIKSLHIVWTRCSYSLSNIWYIKGNDILNNRRREIHNRIKKRKKMKELQERKIGKNNELNRLPSITTYDADEEQNHPLFQKNVFLFKVLLSAALFFAIAILYKYPSSQLDSFRNMVASTFEQEIQFALITDWYEDAFGKPLAFLPSDLQKEVSDTEPVTSDYAIPTTGTIVETFASNGEGIKIETESNTKAGAIQGGTILFAGKKESTGNTVVIQHKDGSESWYGNLEKIDVKVYDSVEKGASVGTVSQSDETGTSVLFFAIKKDGEFIDPDQVISFE